MVGTTGIGDTLAGGAIGVIEAISVGGIDVETAVTVTVGWIAVAVGNTGAVVVVAVGATCAVGVDVKVVGTVPPVAQKFPGTILFHPAKSYDFPFHSNTFALEKKILPVNAIPVF